MKVMKGSGDPGHRMNPSGHRKKSTERLSMVDENKFYRSIEDFKREIGYKGRRNCQHQIDVLRTCKWMEHGGDGVVHLICPRWERRE